MKTIYLHIGIGKTGTTKLQEHLSKCHETLKSNGVHYVLKGGGLQGHGHQAFAKSCISDIPSYMELTGNIQDQRRAVLDEIANEQADTFLLSSENFAVANPADVLSAFDTITDELAFKIILFVRSQDELIESEDNQLIKVRKETMTLEEYRETFFEGDFMALATRWGAAFGEENLICRIYDAKKMDVITDFFSCLPIEASNLAIADTTEPTRAKVNQSLGAMAFFSKLAENDDQSIPDNFDLGKSLPAILMDSQMARKIRSDFAQSNFSFTEKYIGQATEEIGGRRYTDAERDQFYASCEKLKQSISQKQ